MRPSRVLPILGGLLPLSAVLAAVNTSEPTQTAAAAFGKHWTMTRHLKTGQPRRLSGGSLELREQITRDRAEAVARRVLRDYSGQLLVDPEALVLSRVGWREGRQRGTAAATVRFHQLYRGLRVVGGTVTVAFRGSTLTAVNSDFQPGVRLPIQPRVAREDAIKRAVRTSSVNAIEPSDVELVILPREAGCPLAYCLAWQVTLPMLRVPEAQAREATDASVAKGSSLTPDAQLPVRWRLFVDANDGAVLKRINLIHYVGISGEVTGMVSPFAPSDEKVEVPIANITVRINQPEGIATTSTLVDGTYRLVELPAGPKALEAQLAGPELVVLNDETPDPDATHRQSLELGSDDVIHSWNWSADDPSPNDVETNVFYHVTAAQQWFQNFAVSPGPSAPQGQVQAHVRVGPGCNAAGGSGELFFLNGYPDGCPDFGLCTGVIYHEYSHLILDELLTDSAVLGVMHEGLADYFAASISHRSDPNAPCNYRDLDPDLRYPGDLTDAPHMDGRIVAGALWDLEAALGSPYVPGMTLRALEQSPRDFSELLGVLIEEDDDPAFSTGSGANDIPADGTPNLDTICRIFVEQHGIYHTYCANHTERPSAVISAPSPHPLAANRLDGSIPVLEIAGNAQGSLAGPLARFWVEYADDNDLDAWKSASVELAADGQAPVADGPLARLDTTNLPDGHYVIRLTVTDSTGQASQAFTTILVDHLSKPHWPKVSTGIVQPLPLAAELDPEFPGLEVIVRTRWGSIDAWHADGTSVSGWPQVVFHWPNTAPAAADLNADEKLEVIVASQEGVAVFQHDGTQLSGWPQNCPGIIGASGPTVSDLEGDGAPEVLVGSNDGHICAWHADGTPVNGWPAQLTGAADLPLAAADVNGDGAKEVAAVTSAMEICLLTKDGAVMAGWPVHLSFTEIAPVLGNVDGDPSLEVAVADVRQARILNADGSNATGWPQTLPYASDPNGHLVFADLDRDTTPELLLLREGGLWAWRSDGTALAGFPTSFGCPYRCGANPVPSPVAGDTDGDGEGEVLALVPFWSVGRSAAEYAQLGNHQVHRLFSVNQDASISPGWPRSFISNGIPSAPVLADVDQDGQVELLLGADGWLGMWSIPSAGGPATLQWPIDRSSSRRTALFSFPKPDLSIEQVSHAPSAPTAGGVAELTVVVANTGQGPAHAGSLVTISTPEAVSPSARQSYVLPPLSPGEKHSGQVSVRLGSPGTYNSTVTIDVEDDLNTGNNRAVHSFQVLAPETRPDLVISSYSIEPRAPKVGDHLTATLVIRNAGNAPAPACVLRVQVERVSSRGMYTEFFRIPALKPNRTFTLKRTRRIWMAGDYRATAEVDFSHVVEESNENNNVVRATITVSRMNVHGGSGQ